MMKAREESRMREIQIETFRMKEGEIIELVKKAQEGDKKSRDYIIEKNLGLVLSVLKKYRNSNDYEDLFQMGSIGLLKAIERFDTQKGVRFSTYATHMIKGWIRMHLDQYKSFKIPRAIKKNAYNIRRYKEIKLLEKGKEPTDEEIRQVFNLQQEEYALANNLYKEVTSIYQPLQTEEGEKNVSLIHVLKDEHLFEEKLENTERIEEMMSLLNEKERMIIYKRYFEGKRQSELAKLLNHSQAHISRIEKRALKKMKENYQISI